MSGNKALRKYHITNGVLIVGDRRFAYHPTTNRAWTQRSAKAFVESLDIEESPVKSHEIMNIVFKIEEFYIDGVAKTLKRHQPIPIGGTTKFVISCSLENGMVIPNFDDDFYLTIDGRGNSPSRTFLLDFTAGYATLEVDWPNSGRWVINEDTVNQDLDNLQVFASLPMWTILKVFETSK